MNAIVMQQRALQACTSCRKLKRKCTYNPTLGKCDRCFESGKPCVYAEVNSTAPQSGSDAGPGPSATSTNAGCLMEAAWLPWVQAMNIPLTHQAMLADNFNQSADFLPEEGALNLELRSYLVVPVLSFPNTCIRIMLLPLL
ncbi:hypothetical protein K503DRAFT_778907 [Rhizopogon vinicolor AM-OR11-026]|uniref:Zn(2)-C6 fungal-type domain-containing protein n=1 Tax=Rhizopogon vinicolor AM-OR11-026 TaxID=1314800 RepID=A0A1B7NGB8_9AGAM|nr:hypothetical protein K503DRAFT_778907 [Rhizopogon vinicolor AM-OR11-026]